MSRNIRDQQAEMVERTNKSMITQKIKTIRNQACESALQSAIVLDQFRVKFDPSSYQCPPISSGDFQIADNIVVYQHENHVNRKSYAQMIIHEKEEIRFFPTKAQVFHQRTGIVNQDRRFDIGKQTIAVLASRGKKEATGFILKPDNKVPTYDSLSKFDQDLSFCADVSLKDNIKYNCSRFDNGGWVIDTVRMDDLLAHIGLKYNLDEKVVVDDPKVFFGELRQIMAERIAEFENNPNIIPERVELPESSTSFSEERYAQGDHWTAMIVCEQEKMKLPEEDITKSYPFVSAYNSENTLMNNAEVVAEIEKFKLEAFQKEKSNRERVRKLLEENEKEIKATKKVRGSYDNLKSKVRNVIRFVNDESNINRESVEFIKISENTAKTIDFKQKIPVKINRVKIERIRDMMDEIMWTFSCSESEDENDEEFSGEFVEKSTAKSKPKCLPQGTITSANIFEQVFKNESEESDAEF